MDDSHIAYLQNVLSMLERRPADRRYVIALEMASMRARMMLEATACHGKPPMSISLADADFCYVPMINAPVWSLEIVENPERHQGAGMVVCNAIGRMGWCTDPSLWTVANELRRGALARQRALLGGAGWEPHLATLQAITMLP